MEAPQGAYHTVDQEPLQIAGAGVGGDGLVGVDARPHRVLLVVDADRIEDPIARMAPHDPLGPTEATTKAFEARPIRLTSPGDTASAAVKGALGATTPSAPSGAAIGGDGLPA